MKIWSDFRIIRALHNLSDSLREHPVFSALVSPAEKNLRRERSDDRKYVCGACAGFALANGDWLRRTIAFYQVFFQQGRVALGK